MSDPFPPPNFVPAPSNVEGIEVYMPAQEPEPHRPLVEFICPRCGASTAFDPGEGALSCPYCGYREAPAAEPIGKAAAEFEFRTETLAQAAHGWGEERHELACQRCGASTTIPAPSLTLTCPFCGSNKVIQRQAPQDVLRPRFLIPFGVGLDQCRRVLQEWIASSWMTPASLRSKSHWQDLVGIYLPFWTFDASTHAAWKALVGHHVTESYFDPSDGKMKTRSKVVWRRESGQVDRSFDDVLIEGTGKLSALLMGKVNNYDLEQLTPYQPDFLAGLQAKAYDRPLEVAWESARQQMRERTRKACLGQASSSMVREFSMSMDFANESWRYLLLPAYLVSYRFQGQVFQVIVNGQTGALAGQRPVDWRKVGAVAAALLGPGLLLGLAGLLTANWLGAIPPLVGFGLLLLGLIATGLIIHRAAKMDDV